MAKENTMANEFSYECLLPKGINKPVKDLFEQSDDTIANENANKDTRVIPTQRDALAGILSKYYALNTLLPARIARAHSSGDIHMHDLDYSPMFSMFNCMLVDLEGMLCEGYRMGNAEVEDPKGIFTAAAQTAQIIAQVSSHIYGGTSIHAIDEVLAPYAERSYHKHYNRALELDYVTDPTQYAEDHTMKEIHDAMQSLEYEVNTLHTANGQTPFVTFGFGNGEGKWATAIQEEILKVRMKGLGKHGVTPVFPKLVFTIRKGHNSKPSEPNYHVKRLALQCAAKRMYPDILSYEKCIELTGSWKTPMGCRSFLGYHEDGVNGRNNLGVVSLNLPRIALQSNGEECEFWRLLTERVSLAIEALHFRIDRLRNVTTDVAPILYTEGACGKKLKAGDNVMQLFEDGRASISMGYIGIHEMCEIMFPDEPHIFESQVKKNFAKRVMKYMNHRMDCEKESSGFAFSIYGTPSENLCDRFVRIDKETWSHPALDKGYYTNSFHLDVEKKVSLYDKIDFEAEFVELSVGGNISYGEYPDMKGNLDGLEAVWDYAMDHLMYYGTNTPCDKCYDCGYEGEFTAAVDGYTCPKCGQHEEGHANVTRRVCGYLGSPDSRPFIAGKQSEVTRRVKHC